MADPQNSTSLIIGGEVKSVGLSVSGKLFVFTPKQMQFLLSLQKLKSVHAASLSVDKTEEWGHAFLKSRKFKNYISNKMQEYSDKSGLTVEWWYQFGRWSADGYREFYMGHCVNCNFNEKMPEYEIEMHRNDEMRVEMDCPVCSKPLVLEFRKEEFKPSREQVEAWKDLGRADSED